MHAPRPEELLIKSIIIGDGRLPVIEKTVAALVDSIRKVGLLNPIIVFRAAGHMPTLVAGRHRLEACKRLKLKSIQCRVVNADDDEVRAWATLTEIDENLIRRDLTPAQRAKLIAKRKAAYEAVHPETRHGGARNKSKSQTLAFAADTAGRSGRSIASVKADATRAKRLGADLDRVAGTSLDKGAELDALAAMPTEDRAPLIQRAAAGENVSALRPSTAQEPKPGYSELLRTFKAFRSAWLRASAAGQRAFLDESWDDLSAIVDNASQKKAAS
ncbi:ParB/RepB/Spo0J family partition protein [Bradyrhizobium sp. USDA 4350]